MIDELKEDHQKGNVDDEAKETLSGDTCMALAETEYKHKQDHTENNLRRTLN